MTDATVVIPTRNRAEFLKGAVGSALAQTDVSIEVVVVDDASDDASAAVELEGLDARIQVVRRHARGGPGAARNDGIARASGEWVAFLDDDDLWSPTKLRKQLDAASPVGAGFAYGGALAVDELLEPLYLWRVPPPEKLLDSLLALNVVPAGASNVVARTELVRGLGGFDENLDHLCDWDLWTRLAAAAPAARVDEVVTAYRLHSYGQHGDVSAEIRDELDILEAKHAALRAERSVELDRDSMESYLTKRTWQVEARAAALARHPWRRVASRLARRVRKRDPRAPARPVWLQRR